MNKIEPKKKYFYSSLSREYKNNWKCIDIDYQLFMKKRKEIYQVLVGNFIRKINFFEKMLANQYSTFWDKLKKG